MKCCITTIEDVKAFAKYLTNDFHLNFPPPTMIFRFT